MIFVRTFRPVVQKNGVVRRGATKRIRIKTNTNTVFRYERHPEKILELGLDHQHFLFLMTFNMFHLCGITI